MGNPLAEVRTSQLRESFMFIANGSPIASDRIVHKIAMIQYDQKVFAAGTQERYQKRVNIKLCLALRVLSIPRNHPSHPFDPAVKNRFQFLLRSDAQAVANRLKKFIRLHETASSERVLHTAE
jgi:hypothetical protein